MKTVTSRLSIPKLLVPLSATRARIDLEVLYWLEKPEKIKSCLEKWKNRDLTLLGKVQVIKILALPQIILPATLLHVPQNVISELK